MGPVMLKKLQEKFPKLWAEYPDQFTTFFFTNGHMNDLGRDTYAEIKRRHRIRLMRPEHRRLHPSCAPTRLLMRLRKKYPDLWRSCSEDFPDFFTIDGTLNSHGMRALEILQRQKSTSSM